MSRQLYQLQSHFLLFLTQFLRCTRDPRTSDPRAVKGSLRAPESGSLRAPERFFHHHPKWFFSFQEWEPETLEPFSISMLQWTQPQESHWIQVWYYNVFYGAWNILIYPYFRHLICLVQQWYWIPSNVLCRLSRLGRACCFCATHVYGLLLRATCRWQKAIYISTQPSQTNIHWNAKSLKALGSGEQFSWGLQFMFLEDIPVTSWYFWPLNIQLPDSRGGLLLKRQSTFQSPSHAATQPALCHRSCWLQLDAGSGKELPLLSDQFLSVKK